MFEAATYRRRRADLRSSVSDGALLFMGHRTAPRNYAENPYPFRQNSHVLYYAGISRPDVALLMEDGREVLYGPPEDIDDVVWHGPHETIEEAAARSGIGEVRDIEGLGKRLSELRGNVKYVAPYRADVLNRMAELLGRAPSDVMAEGAEDLAEAVAAQRSRKSGEEIAEIEDALGVTAAMHEAAVAAAQPGVREAEVAAAAQRVALAHDRAQSYNPIITVRGEVLHNNDYGNVLEKGQLLLNDSGAESPRFYASDITRTSPVGGRFSPEQRGVYEVVLGAQLAAIEAIRPGVPYRDVHLLSARKIAEGLCGMGLMRGDPDEAVAAGAHALFFPHGVGHMLGLDVHDMEDLGDVVGYARGESRSEQFGLNFLRLARPLLPGFVVTVEPGVYFIPALIDRWRADRRHESFIAYEKLDAFRRFGGIRIEDDVLCTEDGARVLGPGIPKEVGEVERSR